MRGHRPLKDQVVEGPLKGPEGEVGDGEDAIKVP